MTIRTLKMFLRDREVAVLGALAILTVVMWLFFLGRMTALWRLYVSPSYRRDAMAVLSKFRDDTGWGLSNVQITRTTCNGSLCDLTLDFAYHAPAKIHPPHATFRLSWTPGKPESYAIQSR